MPRPWQSTNSVYLEKVAIVRDTVTALDEESGPAASA